MADDSKSEPCHCIEKPRQRGPDGRKLGLDQMILLMDPCLGAHWQAIKDRIRKLAFERLAIGRVYNDQPSFAHSLLVCQVADQWQFLWDYVDLWPLRLYLRFLLSAYADPDTPTGIALRLRKSLDDHSVKHETASASTASTQSINDDDTLEWDDPEEQLNDTTTRTSS
ncbi:hypothetical protein PUNSTDRAFT_132265 [Punctularia strigosozonata HHB-11173 SS5]|uniref:uncharacterized protein n=1 Tax=Punctularia strigosozonata (strain HHB-11173) TaxID=741275 RepID=UPI0004417F15|nr:uncharacterized protein PUNSTDRAFT_132265 [Punctularia strigosozonata HHB-11173 SS5]EIN10160.1 hypothetical protein PUNSTDRAFT_132265 [Punctularia strigosozonata HHB-11173 SS5]